ncbi:MAG: ABC transporter permease [Firmicutes bacterium]|nr:ABC transporter permease [Bacillota bacterium]
MDPRPGDDQAAESSGAADRRRVVRDAAGTAGQVLLAAALGLIIGAVLMEIAGYDWTRAYQGLWLGAFGDPWSVADTLASATPLILTGLAFGLCFRAGYFNIGGQGQMTVGALAAVVVGAYIPVPTPVAVFLVLLAAGAAGAVWSLTPAFLKATRGVHEVISTIMFNWIAFYLALYLAFYSLNDPQSAERTVRVLPGVRLAPLLAGADATAAIFIAAGIALALYWLLWHTPWGYEMRVAGLNPSALRYAGASPVWTINWTFMLAGMAAGIAGATQIIGRPPTYALYGDLSNLGDLGFDGIAVALIGRNHPIGIIASAVFFGALGSGARMMQIMAGVPLDMVRIVHGVIIIALAAPEVWSIIAKSLVRRRAARTEPVSAQAPNSPARR